MVDKPGTPSCPGAADAGAGAAAAGDWRTAAQVVSLAEAKKRKGQGDQVGDAGGAAGSRCQAEEAEKTIDWGKLNYLLENFALIYSTDTVWDGANRMIMKIANMAHAHGSDMVKMWKASEQRRTIMPADVVFDPTVTCDPAAYVNLFGGIELEPKEGDVAPMLELVRYLTSRASADADECDEIMHWLLCWMAYPLQHLGTKLRTAVIMHGDEGAGKNFLFDLWVEIYGKYGALVGQDELEDKFNDWRSAKLAVVGDEVSSRQELVHNKNRLKALITSTTVQINPKNLPRREERNHINIVFLSNELQPLALDNSDRRYLVIYTPRAREFEFYRKLEGVERGGRPGGLLRTTCCTYPLDGFDPFAPAPLTQAKLDLIDMNRKSPERFWLEWARRRAGSALPDVLDRRRPTGPTSSTPSARATVSRCSATCSRAWWCGSPRPGLALSTRHGRLPGNGCRGGHGRRRDGPQDHSDAAGNTDRPEGLISAGAGPASASPAFEQLLSDYLGYEPRSPDGGKQGDKGGDS